MTTQNESEGPFLIEATPSEWVGWHRISEEPIVNLTEAIDTARCLVGLQGFDDARVVDLCGEIVFQVGQRGD